MKNQEEVFWGYLQNLCLPCGGNSFLFAEKFFAVEIRSCLR
jgi:hypothetical protein